MSWADKIRKGPSDAMAALIRDNRLSEGRATISSLGVVITAKLKGVNIDGLNVDFQEKRKEGRG